MTSIDKLREEIAEMPEEARKEFIKSWGEPEELHPDLQPYVVDLGQTGTWVKHPLCFSPMHIPHLNARLNEQYAKKQELLSKYEEEGEWSLIPLLLFERPYRLEAFESIKHNLSDEEYWEVLSEIWTDSENIWQNDTEWRNCLESEREGRSKYFMDEDEQKVFKALPAEVEVYRGYAHDGASEGLSWSLNKERAEWFAKRLVHRPEEKPRLVSGKVKKQHVLAYLNGRQEEEIVVMPELVTDREETEL